MKAMALAREVSEKGFAPTAGKCLIYHDRRGRIQLSVKVYIVGRAIQTDMPQESRAELEIVQGYLDVASSGRRQGRPQLEALMRDARDRAFDCVLVSKFDRLARSTKHLLTALEEFDHLGVRFVSVQHQIDTTSPMGEAMYTLIGAMARHSTKLEKPEGSSSSRETL